MDSTTISPRTAKPARQLQVVLLGNTDAGKGSVGNIILGSEVFDTKKRTAQCVKREGEVAERKIAIVEAPGWSNHAFVENTPELTKQEIILSSSHCSPGPHIILLVIKDLQEDRADQEHLELLGERVWDHTIVLFSGDLLNKAATADFIVSNRQHFQWLEKCGNRFHVLNKDNSGDRRQVIALIEKIEALVAKNGGSHYKLEKGILQKLITKREEESVRIEDRKMRLVSQRNTLKFVMGGIPQLLEMNIMLVGNSVAGKTSAANTILGIQQFSVWNTTQCFKDKGSVAGRQITVIDTPGWGDGALVEYSAVKHDAMSQCVGSSGPTAYVLVIKLDQSFSKDHRQSTQKHLELFGKEVWNRTIVLFTHGDWLGDTSVEQYIESEGRALEWIMEKCGNRYHVFNNKNTSDITQVRELIDKIEEMVAIADIGPNETEREDEKNNESSIYAEAKNEMKIEIQEDWMNELPCVEDRGLERTVSRSMVSPPSMASGSHYSFLRRSYSLGSLEAPRRSWRSRAGSFNSTDYNSPWHKNRRARCTPPPPMDFNFKDLKDSTQRHIDYLKRKRACQRPDSRIKSSRDMSRSVDDLLILVREVERLQFSEKTSPEGLRGGDEHRCRSDGGSEHSDEGKYAVVLLDSDSMCECLRPGSLTSSVESSSDTTESHDHDT